MGKYGEGFIDDINVASFLIGLINYQENLTQSDKDDIMNHLDQQTKDILTRVEKDLEEQNKMLRMILNKLEGGTKWTN